jgi:putative FmdB family regulatory protein
MPLYEYVCEQDGTVVEVQRPMADADKPLTDPEGKGRTFRRKLSTFAARGGTGPTAHAAAAATTLPMAGCCPCGKPGGGCAAQ